MESAVFSSLSKTVSANPKEVKVGTDELASLLGQQQTGFVMALCNLIKDSQPTERLSAAVYLKNLVRSRWEQRADPNAGLSADSRRALQEGVVSLIFCCPKNIKSFLLDALGMMAETDVPYEWNTLLPHLVKTYLCAPADQVNLEVRKH